MKIKQPFGRRFAVQPFEKKQVLISDDGTLSEYGTVIAIGSKCEEIKVGDIVGFSVFGVEKLIIDDDKYYFLKEDDEFVLTTLED